MELVRLGRTDAAVSRLGCGGAPAGLRNYLAPYDPAGPAAVEVVAAVQRALELGVTYFDTAPGYGDGASERLFGEGLRGAGEHVFVASKCGAGGPLRDSVSRSLERLGRDRLDLLQLHGSSWRAEEVDRILGDGGVADQLAALRTEGLVRYLGFTSEDQNPGFWRLLQSGRFDVVQLCYNVLLQHPYDPSRPFGSLYQAAELGLGTVAMRSLTSGLFTAGCAQSDPPTTSTGRRRCCSLCSPARWSTSPWSACGRRPRWSATWPSPRTSPAGWT